MFRKAALTPAADAVAFRALFPVAELRRRQPALATLGLAFLMLAIATAALPTVDGRMLGGVSVWAKPAKFFLSAGILLLTSAWFFGLVAPERRKTAALEWSVRVLAASASFELLYITIQAARGEQSHFNRSDDIHAALYGLMGLAAVAMLATKIPLALEIARRPRPGLDPVLRRAVVTGLWMTIILGALTGLYMGQRFAEGHDVGAVGGAAPVFGWNREGGDLRVAHFFGMHAEQVVPIAAWASAGLAAKVRRRIVAASAVALAALTIAVFVQAIEGRPFPSDQNKTPPASLPAGF